MIQLPTPTPASAATPDPVTFTFTGGTQTYTVPDGVTAVTITADGGHGGRSPYDASSVGGSGGLAAGTIAVTPGDQLTVIVGGDAGSGGRNCGVGGYPVNCGGYGAGLGGSSFYGGGGGGGSAVTTAGGTSLVVAGGGAGAGTGQECESGPSGRAAPGNGGPAGLPGGTGDNCDPLTGGGGGGAGTATAAGAGGAAGTGTAPDCEINLAGTAGPGGSGRDGASNTSVARSGGAGGGGWYGGGGGGTGASTAGCANGVLISAAAGGGGGGSSHVDSLATDPSTGLSARAFGSNGQVTISYPPRTVADRCFTDTGPGQIGRFLTIAHFPANASLSGFVIDYYDDNTNQVANGFPMNTDSSGSAASGPFPESATHPASERRAVIFRDLNGNQRWDPDTDDTLFQGTAHLAANACDNVTYAPK